MHCDQKNSLRYAFNFANIHSSWQKCITQALNKVDQDYLSHLSDSPDWLPGPHKIFNAFSIPMEKVQYVLFGESPYPRSESANGYAFWDESIVDLWSNEGLSKKVNRATSMRNIMKMLLVAEGALTETNTSQEAIAAADKTNYVKSNLQLFSNLLSHGFLLLNATLVLQPTSRCKDAKCWQPFLQEILSNLLSQRPDVKLILFGRIANQIDSLIPEHPPLNKLIAEHPYNHTFVTNQNVIKFFQPLHLLRL